MDCNAQGSILLLISMWAGDCDEAQPVSPLRGKLQSLVSSRKLLPVPNLTRPIQRPPPRYSPPIQAAQNTQWATNMAYPYPHHYAKTAASAVSLAPRTSGKWRQASTGSLSSSPVSRKTKEISTTTVYDVSAVYLIPLCVCNFILIVGSAIIFFISLYATFEEDETEVPSSARSSWLATLLLHLEVVLMVASGSLFITATLGLLGALRQNIFLLKVYSVVMTGLMLVAFFSAVAIAGIPFMARNVLTTHVTEDFVVHYRDNAGYQQVIDYLQKSLQCCGMSSNGYRDWQANAYFACNKSNPSAEKCSVPHSCCKTAFPTSAEDSLEEQGTTELSGPRLAPSTLCGRGVLRMAESDAWKVINLRGCGDALFQNLRAHNFEILAAVMLLSQFLLLLATLAGSVRMQIKALTKIYNKYYKVCSQPPRDDSSRSAIVFPLSLVFWSCAAICQLSWLSRLL